MDLNDETYDRLISQIFSAALDGSQWQGFLDTLAQASPGTRTQLHGHDFGRTEVQIGAFSGYDGSLVESWYEYYGLINIWAPGMLKLPVGVATAAEAVAGEEEVNRSEFYNDWVRPQEDIRSGACVIIDKSPNRFFALGGNMRAVDAEDHRDDFVDLLQRLTPHLQAAMSISRRIGALEIENSVLAQAGGARGAAVLVLDAARSVVYANAAAQVHLAEGAPLRCDRRGRVSLSDRAADRRLGMALGQLLTRGDGQGTAVFRLPGAGPALICRTARLDLPELALHSALLFTRALDAPCLLVTLARDFSASQAHRALIANHALTTAEADIAVGVTEGHGLAELAEARGTSLHTVRNQLKAVLSKTGLHGQRDLVRLVIHLGS